MIKEIIIIVTNMEDKKNFHIVDYIIFGGMLVASMIIGLFFAFCKKKEFSSADYFFGGKKMRSLPVALSFIVTFQSSLMFLGVPAEVYGYGMKFSLEVIGIMIAFVLGTFIAVPVFRPLQITSIYKYFNLRYGSNEVRFIAAAGGVIYLVFYMAVVVLGTCVALTSVLRVPFWTTVLTYTAVTAIYTSLGGFKAVIWTDVFQLCVMLCGITAILIATTTTVGGPSAIYSLAEERFQVSDFRLDPTVRYTVWNCVFGPITQFMVLFFTQAGLQRIKSTPTTRSTYVMFLIATPFYCFFAVPCFFEGIAIFAYYSSIGCDPLASGRILDINEIVPTAVMDLFGDMPGLPGLFIASLSSAALSTLSSCLTGLSSITFEDIIKIRYPNMSDKKATKLCKAVVFVYGVLSMGLCFLMSLMTGPIYSIFQAVMGSIDGPTCGVFILSIFFLRSTTKGVIIGGISGMLVTLTFNIGQIFLSVRTPAYLPLGPTDNCIASNLTNVFAVEVNSTNELVSNLYGLYSTFTPASVNATVVALTETGIHVEQNTRVLEKYGDNTAMLEKIFGVSFMLLSLTGFLVTVIVGIIASLLTKKTEKEDIDTMTLYPLPDQFCRLFPSGFFYSVKSKEIEKIKEENLKLMTEDTKQNNVLK